MGLNVIYKTSASESQSDFRVRHCERWGNAILSWLQHHYLWD